MNKTIKMLTLLSSLFMLAGCGKGNKVDDLKNLKDNQTLHIGDSIFKNYQTVNTYTYSYSYKSYVVNTLYRSTYSSGSSVYHNGYYYYWNIDTVSNVETAGTYDVVVSHSYSYLVFEKDTSILLKTKSETSYTYNYKGGWFDKTTEIHYTLNGYFTTISVLNEVCPELYANAYNETKQKVYVKDTSPTTIEYTERLYTNTYYYFN